MCCYCFFVCPFFFFTLVPFYIYLVDNYVKLPDKCCLLSCIQQVHNSNSYYFVVAGPQRILIAPNTSSLGSYSEKWPLPILFFPRKSKIDYHTIGIICDYAFMESQNAKEPKEFDPTNIDSSKDSFPSLKLSLSSYSFPILLLFLSCGRV